MLLHLPLHVWLPLHLGQTRDVRTDPQVSQQGAAHTFPFCFPLSAQAYAICLLCNTVHVQPAYLTRTHPSSKNLRSKQHTLKPQLCTLSQLLHALFAGICSERPRGARHATPLVSTPLSWPAGVLRKCRNGNIRDCCACTRWALQGSQK